MNNRMPGISPWIECRGRPPNEVRGELPKMVAGLSGQNDLAAYNALLQAGYIRRPEEYLPDVYGRKEA
jgi:hypothetical protein